MKRTIALTLLLLPLLAATASRAAGYDAWAFGMTRAEVTQQTAHGPYYTLGNGNLGLDAGPYEGGAARVSFYFDADRLVRVMLIPYLGDDPAPARAAWAAAYAHIQRVAGAVEVPDAGSGAAALAVAMAAFDRRVPTLEAGQRIHIGAFPMPGDRRIWATVTRLPDDRIMVSVNHGAP